jgi:L-lysine 2,3-aminomutase
VSKEEFGIPLEELEAVARKFKIRTTPYYFSLIKKKDDPIWPGSFRNLKIGTAKQTGNSISGFRIPSISPGY